MAVDATPILLIGAGGHARACIDVIEQEDRHAVVAIVGLAEEVGRSLLGYPIVAADDQLEALRCDCSVALVTVGQIKTPRTRIALFERLTALDFELPVVISPHAYVSPHARVGRGTIVMHGATVNAGAVVGENCILNSHSLMEHDATVADHCHISTAAVLNGGAVVGEGSFIGSGAVTREMVNIGAGSVIGRRRRVTADCAEGTRLSGREND